MATVTQDAQSFFLDGRRIWLVSGTIDYFRVPQEEWADRIADAVDAGLNTILVRCPWAIHEPRQGEFEFEGDADVVKFVEMIGEAGLLCALRPGPYIGSDLDLGGMPSWLLSVDGVRLREGNAPFLEATSRYFGALLGRLAPLSASKDGPVVLVQCEHEWACGNAQAAEQYLLEIARFTRENDFDVPLFNTNNLWQRREESIDTWCGRERMLSHLRQLQAINPSVPLMVGDFWVGDQMAWGEEAEAPRTGASLMRQLAQVLASRAQFNLSPFHAGTNFGFLGARYSGSTDRFATTTVDHQAIVGEAGVRSDAFPLIRRLCTFASRFGRVLSALEPQAGLAALSVEPTLAAPGRKGAKPGPSVIELKGQQGDIVFVFGEEGKNQAGSLMLSNGYELPFQLGDQPVGWYLMDVHVAPRSRLDFTNLNAFALVSSRVLVLFGAPGQHGVASINSSVIEFEVPRGQTPLVEEHEGVVLVVMNGLGADVTRIHEDVVYVGVDGFDDEGTPRPASGWKNHFRIDTSGSMSRKANGSQSRRQGAVTMEPWKTATIGSYMTGEAPRFATIDGPTTQENCAAGSGYGLMRIQMNKGPGKRIKVLSPGLSDRVHLYVNGQFRGIVGEGPGANRGPFDLSLPASKPTIVGLIDNVGRYAGGNDMNEGKGIVNHFYEVTELKIGRSKKDETTPLKPFEMRGFIEGLHAGATTTGADSVWSFDYRRKAPLILEINGAETPAMIRLNEETIGFYAGLTGRPYLCMVLDHEVLRRGKNELRIAPIALGGEPDVASTVTVYETKGCLSDSATWAFAKWEMPKPMTFRAKSKSGAKAGEQPAWFRAKFTIKSIAGQNAWLEPTGMTKGQIYLNGHNVGRYFVSTHDGKSVPPQKRYLLPTPWLNLGGEPNELVMFDEHGHSPSKVKIVFGHSALG